MAHEGPPQHRGEVHSLLRFSGVHRRSLQGQVLLKQAAASAHALERAPAVNVQPSFLGLCQVGAESGRRAEQMVVTAVVLSGRTWLQRKETAHIYTQDGAGPGAQPQREAADLKRSEFASPVSLSTLSRVFRGQGHLHQAGGARESVEGAPDKRGRARA